MYKQEFLGQHFLEDEAVIHSIVNNVDPDTLVLEVGAGDGRLTKHLANKAKKVIAYEKDPSLKDVLQEAVGFKDNVDVEMGDFLSVNIDKIARKNDLSVQVVGNIPFQITEPLLEKLTESNVDKAVLLVGNKFVRSILARDPEDEDFSRTGLMARTFYDVRVVRGVDSSSFVPNPSTDTSIIVMDAKLNDDDINPGAKILQQLFLSGSKNNVLNVIKTSANQVGDDNMDKKSRNRGNRRELRQMTKFAMLRRFDPEVIQKSIASPGDKLVKKLDLPFDIANKPFKFLNNNELAILTQSIENYYGDI